MADCAICEKPVVTHRYVRAKRLDDEKASHVFIGVSVIPGGSLVTPVGSCPGHTVTEVGEELQKRCSKPVRLLWAPEGWVATTLWPAPPGSQPGRSRGPRAVNTTPAGIPTALAELVGPAVQL